MVEEKRVGFIEEKSKVMLKSRRKRKKVEDINIYLNSKP